jgi:small subunit ribosomal protein S21
MRGSILDPNSIGPIEVKVEGSSREDFEYAFRKFKALFQRERIVGQIKERMAYEKPSAKKRRKEREAVDRRVMTQIRENMVKTGEWDRRQKARAQNQIKRDEKRSGVTYER